jgi:hypothetical protein
VGKSGERVRLPILDESSSLGSRQTILSLPRVLDRYRFLSQRCFPSFCEAFPAPLSFGQADRTLTRNACARAHEGKGSTQSKD